MRRGFLAEWLPLNQLLVGRLWRPNFVTKGVTRDLRALL